MTHSRLVLPRRDLLLGLSALAAVAPLGCGSDDDSGKTSGTPTPTGDYFPPNGSDEWETVAPEDAGFSASGLDALKTVVESNHSSSFMILVDGRIVVEWYFMGASATTRTDVASVQKSFSSTLMGLARARGLLDFDDKVSDYLPDGWSNATPAEEAPITLRHLMTHSSGLSDTTLEKVHEPGAVFNYNTAAYQKTRPVLEAVAGKDINALSREWLFDAIDDRGAWKDRGKTDPTGAAIWGLDQSARDMARFGLLAQRGGKWHDKAVTDSGWFAEAWSPSQAKADYGLLWWLQGQGKLKNKAPADLVSALGARDQKIYVVPSLEAVVTRQGLAAGVETEAESDFDLVLLKAIADARIPA
ncbi:MAG: serine hydrolase [Polyangiaceae bacterium]